MLKAFSVGEAGAASEKYTDEQILNLGTYYFFQHACPNQNALNTPVLKTLCVGEERASVQKCTDEQLVNLRAYYIFNTLTLEALKYFCINHGDQRIFFAFKSS